MTREKTAARLRGALSLDLGDWFEFEVGEPAAVSTGAAQGGFRFPIRCLLEGRTFENLHLDLGQGDPVVGKPDKLTGPPLLQFAGIPPPVVYCCPRATQIAEKVHAYTRAYSGGESSRVRDLVDILLMASIGGLSSLMLRRALKATFEAGATHQLPEEFPKPRQAGPVRTRSWRANWASAGHPLARLERQPANCSIRSSEAPLRADGTRKTGAGGPDPAPG